MVKAIFHFANSWQWYNQVLLFGGLFLVLLGISMPLALYISNKLKVSKEAAATIPQPHQLDIPELRDSVINAKVVWGMWHSGDRIRNEKLFEYGTIKRILVLDPIDNPALKDAVGKAREDFDDVVAQIKSATKIAVKNGVIVKWHKEYRDISITIYDLKPVKFDNGEPIPSSNEAYIVVQVLEPEIPRDLRHTYKIVNNGKDTARFDAFMKYFDSIWNNKSRIPDPKEYK